MNPEPFGPILRAWIVKKRFKHKEAAEILGINVWSLRDYLAGKHTPVRMCRSCLEKKMLDYRDPE